MVAGGKELEKYVLGFNFQSFKFPYLVLHNGIAVPQGKLITRTKSEIFQG